ncbi:hypothetical protein ACAH01_03095 [Halomicrobium sp. HM KBTZ05]|uniref:hypothetical protein n=1 Tax=Halomicrobium sp. HM KBTZ05 TaxID=3242663 RepID=UPI0035565DD9
MAAFSLFAIVLLFIQIGVGYSVFRSFEGLQVGFRALLAGAGIVLGLVVLVVFGVVVTLVFDLVVVLVTGGARGYFDSPNGSQGAT